MALRPRQGEVRVHDPARDAAGLLPLRDVGGPASTGDADRVVLVGAGHAHALVLERWARTRPSGLELTVVTERAELLYSGMVPGLVAGEYRRDRLVIDARHLAHRARADLVVQPVRRVDPDARRLELADGSMLGYDVASLDIGSVPARAGSLGSTGASRARRVSSRAPDALLDALRAVERPAHGDPAPRVLVVGGGAAGVELAAAVHARLTRSGREPGVTVVERRDRLMAGYAPGVSERVRRALEDRGVEVRLGTTADPEASTRPPPGLVILATGAAAPPLLRSSGLPTDPGGFVRVQPTLRVVGRDDLFAAGDCASLSGCDVPKAGVHAVRQAPVLFENLMTTVRRRERARAQGDDGGRPAGDGQDEGEELRAYEPQGDFLTLLNLGDGTALGTKWGRVVEGRWVRWLKDAIDRRFVERFRA